MNKANYSLLKSSQLLTSFLVSSHLPLLILFFLLKNLVVIKIYLYLQCNSKVEH